MRRERVIAVALGLTLAALATPTTSAGAEQSSGPEAQSRALPGGTVVRTVNLPTGALYSHYTLAPDGTFWVANGGPSGLDISHYDDQGTDLGDGFTKVGSFPVQSIGIWLDRVYLTTNAQIRSWLTDGTDELGSDPDTNQRLGGNQAILRVSSGGGARIALGQSNKIVTMDFTSLVVDHPFYGQAWSGAGINSTSAAVNAFQSCVLVPGGPYSGTPDTTCGTYPGRTGPEVGRLNYPIDIATNTGNTLAVLENGGLLDIARVTLINASGPSVSGTFGSFGSGAGDLKYPFSIVTQPSTGHYFISDPGNLRISEYSGGGAFVKSFGRGVRTGGAAFETCGAGFGACVPGNGPQYERLDFGPDGLLYAQYAGSTVQVIDVGATTGPPPVKDAVRLKAKDTKVEKGKKTKLTATVSPASSCFTRKVRFQIKAKSGWDNIGGFKAVPKSCTVSAKTPKIKAKEKFRVVSLLGSTTLATSPVVTVKPKK